MTVIDTNAAPTDNTTPATVADTAPAATGSETPAGSTDAPQDDANAPAVPEAYAFTMPEGMTLDQAAVDRFSPVFKELALSQEQVDKLVAAQAEYMQSLQAGSGEAFEKVYAERQAAEVASQIAADGAALKKDAEVGGANFDSVKAEVYAFLGQHGTAEFTAFVDSKGISNNPEFVRVLHRALRSNVTDLGAQPSGGGGAPAQKSPASVLWPNLPSGT